MKKILLAISLAFTISSGSAYADTVYCVNCGNESTQYANYAQLYQQTSNMIQQLEVLRTQAARLSSDTPFSQTSDLLKNIMSVVNQGQAIGYDLGVITQKFEMQYPGVKVKGSYFDEYSKWSETTGVENDGGHAFYLGVELARAQIAQVLGKRYAQDQPLTWGIHGRAAEDAPADPNCYTPQGTTLKASRSSPCPLPSMSNNSKST